MRGKCQIHSENQVMVLWGNRWRVHKDSYYEWQAQTFFHVISYIQLGTFCLNMDHRFSFPTSNQQTIYWPGSQTHYDRHTFSSSKSYSEQVTKDRNTMPQALSRYGQVHSVESILKQSRLLWPNVQQFHVNQHFIFTAHCLFYHLLHCAGDGTHGLHTLQWDLVSI